MNREQLIELLKENKPTLAQRFGVIELALFGSFARDEAASDSDVDILVRFGKPPTGGSTLAPSSSWKNCLAVPWTWQRTRS